MEQTFATQPPSPTEKSIRLDLLVFRRPDILNHTQARILNTEQFSAYMLFERLTRFFSSPSELTDESLLLSATTCLICSTSQLFSLILNLHLN